MKKYLIWSLSILLGFEPAVFAASGATARAPTDMNQIAVKNWISNSGISQRSVTLEEILQNTSGALPPEQKAQIEKYLAENGLDPKVFRLPKMDVTQYKDTQGNTVYKLQAVKNGQAVTLEILNSPSTFAKLNGQALTPEDLTVLPSLLEKLHAPPMKTQLLSAQQVQKLSQPDRVQYFKQLRLLLESMEAVQQVRNSTKTSQLDSSKWNAIVQLLAGTEYPAWAQENGEVRNAAATNRNKTNKGNSEAKQAANPETQAGAPKQKNGQRKGGSKGQSQAQRPSQDPDGDSEQGGAPSQPTSDVSCIAGGWAAQVTFDSSTRRKACASDGSGGIRPEFRGDKCDRKKFLCNPALYGGSPICVAAGATTTAECNSSVTGRDIPDLANNAAEFNALKEAAVKQATALREICQHSAELPPGLREDQQKTCESFELRFKEISSWDCANTEFAKAHSGPKVICPNTAEKQPPVVAMPPVPVASPAPTVTPAPPVNADQNRVDCARLPLTWSLQDSCTGGSSVQKTCFSGTTPLKAFDCQCDDGNQFLGPNKCSTSVSSGSSDGKTRPGKTEKSEKSKSKFDIPWVGIGVGLTALAAYFYMDKKARDQAYKNAEPQLQNPPVAPPFTTPPAPPAVPQPPTPRTVK